MSWLTDQLENDAELAAATEKHAAALVKWRPIPFSGPMVRAILEGRKTQTRRVVKDPPKGGLTPGHRWFDPRTGLGGVIFCRHSQSIESCDERVLVKCPYGQPGDRLWVRETWYDDDALRDRDRKAPHQPDNLIHYRADGEARTQFEDLDGFRWRPSIHMPRWASRITLELTEVRVERLQDISEEDAMAEGCQMRIQPMPKNAVCMDGVRRPVLVSSRGAFRELWDSINADRPGCSWSDNPWVWALSFRRVEA